MQSIGSDLNRIGDPISAKLTRTVLREADSIVTVSGDLCAKAISMGADPDTHALSSTAVISRNFIRWIASRRGAGLDSARRRRRWYISDAWT